MREQDLLRIVRNMLSQVVDLVDSTGDEKKISAVLLNVRNGAAGFLSLLDEVILDRTLDDMEELDVVPEDDELIKGKDRSIE